MCENLKRWLGGSSIHAAGHTELSADVVRAGCCSVSGKRGLGEISALLGLVLNESGGIEIGLRNWKIEDTSAGRDGDRYRHVHACFGSCRASKYGHCEGGFGEHV